MPHLLGVHQKPVLVDRMIVPPVRDGLHLMSIGFFLDENSPVMWRGPMLHRALEQFLSDVHWPELDTLLVDMPPGTGDVAISLGQLLPRAEVIVVTTPQPLAQEVAVRAAQMAQRTNTRLVGVVENMTSEIFGSGGGERLAADLGIPLLGRCRSTRGCARAATSASRSLAAPKSAAAVALAAIAESVARSHRPAPGRVAKPLVLRKSFSPRRETVPPSAGAGSGRGTRRLRHATGARPASRRGQFGRKRIEGVHRRQPRALPSSATGTSAEPGLRRRRRTVSHERSKGGNCERGARAPPASYRTCGLLPGRDLSSRPARSSSLPSRTMTAAGCDEGGRRKRHVRIRLRAACPRRAP